MTDDLRDWLLMDPDTKPTKPRRKKRHVAGELDEYVIIETRKDTDSADPADDLR